MWGIVLGVALAVGDVLLTPADQGETVTFVGLGRFVALAACLSLILTWTFLAWTGAEGRKRIIVPAAGVGIALLVVVAIGSATPELYGSDDVPGWRFAVLPSLAIVAAGCGALLIRKEPSTAERLLLTGLVAAALVGYAQEAAMTWALVVGVVVTYAWLALPFGTFSGTTGLVMHALAILALAQAEPSWFTWTPFPFLTFYPIYVLAAYLLRQDATQRRAWWVGVVVTGATTLLGFTTLIGNLRRGLPVSDSLVMLGGGSVFLTAFVLLRFTRAVEAGQEMPTT